MFMQYFYEKIKTYVKNPNYNSVNLENCRTDWVKYLNKEKILTIKKHPWMSKCQWHNHLPIT